MKRESLRVYEESLPEHPAEGEYQPLSGQYYVTEKKRTDKNTNEQFDLDEDEHGTYMMNSKDLCAIELLKELRDAGVISFKVEGRSKGLYYVATVARAYRGAIDDVNAGRPFDSRHLAEVVSTANRTLMTGFLLRRPEEYGQNYSDGASRSLTHDFAAQVIEIDPASNRARVLVKNKLRLGDVVEWISPEGTIEDRISFIEPEFGDKLGVISGGNQGIINCPPGTTTFWLLRKPLTVEQSVATAEQSAAL